MSLRQCRQSLHPRACQQVNKAATAISRLLADRLSASMPARTKCNPSATASMTAILTRIRLLGNCENYSVTTKTKAQTPVIRTLTHSAHQFRIHSGCELQPTSSSGLALRTPSLRRYSTVPATSLWSSGSTDIQSPVQVNLDLKTRLSGQNVDLLQLNFSARGIDFDLDQLLLDFEHWKELDKVKVKLEEERSSVAKAMAVLVKDTKTRPETKTAQREALVERGKAVKEQLRELMPAWWAAEKNVMVHALQLPTDLHPSTPERDQEVKLTKGTVHTCDGTSHVKIGAESGLLKFSNVGPRAVYLMGRLAEMEQSLLHFVSMTLANRGFSPLTGSDIFRTVVAEGCGLDQRNPEEIFTIHQKEDDQQETNSYHLRGGSLLTYAAFFAKMQISAKHLPVKMHSVGRHYTPPTDHDLPGLYGPIQSNRVTMFAACSSGDAATEVHREMMEAAWDIAQSTGLPARTVQVSAKRLSSAESARTEVQVWAPSLQRFVQVAHGSIHDDYPSRRLMSRLSQDQPLHMVSGVTLDTAPVLASILEHSDVKGQFDLMPLPCLQQQNLKE